LLVINAINFGLLMFALWYFLYGPLIKIIDERRRKVAQGVEDADAAAARLREIEASRSAMLAEAGKESDEVLAKAREAAGKRESEIIAAGEASAARIIADAEAAAREAKERSIEESKKEVAKLVVLGIEKTMAGQK
jgi:F-type H+-transporting ATPase subunit b